MGDETVNVDPQDLAEIAQRLSDKKSAVEKELLALREAPSGSKDVFQLCRGFERAFTLAVESTDVAAQIRRAFESEQGLRGAVNKLPFEEKFRLDHVKAIVKEADGYQGHLVSPEKGLRRLVNEAIALTYGPVDQCVRMVHLLLLNAARDAATKASLMTEEGLSNKVKEPLRLPAFEAAIMTATTMALEDWREEALEVARTIVAMEQSYVTAAFFRARLRDRVRELEEREKRERTLLMEGGGVAAESDSDTEDSTNDSPTPVVRRDRQDRDASHFMRESSDGLGVIGGPMAGGIAIPAATESGGDLKAGYLEKRIGEHSNRQGLPESFKWQRRYWVLAEQKGMLYYFKSEDDPPKYRGVINMRECKVEDVDANGFPKSARQSSHELEGGSGTVSLLIKLSNKDPNRSLLKNHRSIVLRAESASEKYAWLARLRYAAESGAVPRTPMRSFTSDKLLRRTEDAPAVPPKAPEQRKTRETSDLPPRAPNAVEHDNARLGEPVMFSSPGGGGLARGDADSKRMFDEYLATLGGDTAAYVREKCSTIVLTVPKAIVHCQVKRAQTHLLERLYAHISNLRQYESDALLEEDQDIMQRRAAAKRAAKDMDDAILTVARIQEARANNPANLTDTVQLAAQVLQLAGLTNLLPSPDKHAGDQMYGSYTPRSLANGSGPFSGGHSRSRSYADAVSPRAGETNPVFGENGGRAGAAASSATLQARPSSARRVGLAPPKVSIPTTASATSTAAPSPNPMPRRRPPPAPPA